jgi:hypothetical protein
MLRGRQGPGLTIAGIRDLTVEQDRKGASKSELLRS